MARDWYVHIGGDTFGPISTDVIRTMLRQTRLHFSDFVWTDGLTKWMRISDSDEFAGLLPPYPKNPIPSPHGDVPIAMPTMKRRAPDPEEETDPTPLVVPRTGKVIQSAEELKEAVASKLAAHPRFEVHGTVKIDTGESYKIVDLSEGGVFLASQKPPAVGTQFTFVLETEGLVGKLKMSGIVIRHGDRCDQVGFAIEFIRVNPAYKRALQEFLTKFSKVS